MKLKRFLFRKDCTIGTLQIGGRVLFTLELPWKDNSRNVSCIPEGTYMIKPHGWEGEAVRYEKVWEVRNVPNRTAILIHVGNYPKNTNGCILVGTGVTINDDVAMVTNSQDAIDYMRKCIKNGFITIER